MSTSPQVTVVILNYHGENQLVGCLEHLAAQIFSDWEVIIVDNSPDDGVIDELLKNHPLDGWVASGKAAILRNRRNEGFARGTNQGISKAKGEYILLLNQDVFMDPGYMGGLVSVLNTHPDAGSVTGKLLRMDGVTIDSTGHEFYNDRVVINRGKGLPDNDGPTEPEEVFGVSAAAAMYRLSALRDVAFHGEIFDEDFFAYLEDIDMDFRLRRAGYSAWYTPFAVARHALAGSGGRRSFSIRFKAHTNRNKIIIKHDSIGPTMLDLTAIYGQEFINFVRTLVTSPLLLFSYFTMPFKLPRLYTQRAYINRTAKISFDEIYCKWVRHGRVRRSKRG